MPHWSLPRDAASAKIMIRVAGKYGASPEACIAGTGLTQDDLLDPTRVIGGEQELGVLRNILGVLPSSVPFAFLAGQHYHLTSQGMLGFAIMSCSNGWAALNVTTRYFDLSFSFNRLSFETHRSRGRLLYESDGKPEDLRLALIERDIGALATFQRDSLARVLPAHAIKLSAPRPAYSDPFRGVFGVSAQYGAEVSCVDFDLALLDTVAPRADERGRRLSEAQCQALLEERGLRAGLTARVHSRIVRTPDKFPSMQTAAAELGMSTRTLRNRLAHEGTSFRELVEQAREVLAGQFLEAGMTLDAITERLGYADTSAFVTAFKRWKGVTPGRYRRTTRPRLFR